MKEIADQYTTIETLFKMQKKVESNKQSNYAEIYGYNDNNKWNKELMEHIYTTYEIPFIVSISNIKGLLPIWKAYA